MTIKKHNGYCEHNGYCGIIRKMDFEDRHPIIAGVMALAAIVIVGAIVMVIF